MSRRTGVGIHGLGKRFRVGPREDWIWALRDVSCEVGAGQAVGIMGRNGSGKSTLLKILSRVTAPTEGWADLRGRVRAILEIGTGFHPDLNGAENIYLYGAMLGITRAEIARHFEAIVSFAELERFVQTPVKHYSSGMQLRLAFSIATHVETDILLVDEGLTVGDTAFQERCVNIMQEKIRRGWTILFVSHNVAVLRQLCPTALLLEQGRVVCQGPSGEVADAYAQRLQQAAPA